MHRIDGADNVAGRFSAGDPTQGVPGTIVTADWMNAVQEEIAAVVEGAGIALDKPTNTQLRDVITAGIRSDPARLRLWARVGLDGSIGLRGGAPGGSTITPTRIAAGRYSLAIAPAAPTGAYAVLLTRVSEGAGFVYLDGPSAAGGFTAVTKNAAGADEDCEFSVAVIW